MKTVLVTGGVRGIGKGIALAFQKKGYRVCVTYSKDEKSAEEMKALGFEVFQSDVAVEEEVLSLFQQIGKVDILINNAGVALVKQIQDVSYAEYERLMSVNMGGAFLCTREAVKGMLPQKSGLIVNISSVWGEVGGSCESVYSASKAGLIGFTKALAKERGYSGIRVNSVSPGMILDEPKPHIGTWLGRCGTGDEVARAIAFLASDNASYITGIDMPVEGGRILGPKGREWRPPEND